jgi:hypothetical protein
MGATGKDLHISAPLTNLVHGFTPTGMIVDQLFPITTVSKQTDLFYKWGKDDFFRIPDSRRAPKTKGRVVNTEISSETYHALNYALVDEISFEDLENADNQIRLKERKAQNIKKLLMMDWENRVSSTVTSTSNVGSSTTLTGANQWSDFGGTSDPINDVMVGKESIRSTTGLAANVAVIPEAVMTKLIQHPLLVDRVKFTGNLNVTIAALQELFGIDKILVPSIVKNTAEEGATGSYSDIWGKDMFFAHIEAATPNGDMPSYGYTFRWNNPRFGGSAEIVESWDDPDNRGFNNIRVQNYQAEKIVSNELGFLIKDAIA